MGRILTGISGTLRRASGRPAVPAGAPRLVRTKKRGRQIVYAPNIDGDADPGEIVWTWVAYEEDASQGKDRPVLVVGRDERTLLGLMISSQSKRNGQRHWLALGPGPWDAENRPSWLRLDRILEVEEGRHGIRREGAILDPQRFTRVADILKRNYRWQ